MTDQQRDKEIQEEIRLARTATRKKRTGARRMLPFLLVLAVVLGAVGYFAAQNFSGTQKLRQMLTYRKTPDGETDKTVQFRYDNDRTAHFAWLEDTLLVVSTTRVLLLDASGEELFSRTVNFSHPAIALGTHMAAAYDVGGKELYLLDARGSLRDMSEACANGLLSVSLNPSDYLALTTTGSGCRAAVTAYDDSGEALFSFRSSERYISGACVLSDNRHLAAVTLGEADGIFASMLTFYAFDSDQSLSETTLGGSMVLSLCDLGGKLAVLEDDRLTLFNADGSLSGSRRYDYPCLRAQSMGGNGFAALLLSRYRSGSTTRLCAVNAEGEVLGSLDLRREVLDVSAAGERIAVLFGDSLTIYNTDLSECVTLTDTGYARRVILRADGRALLLGTSRAWLYEPG